MSTTTCALIVLVVLVVVLAGMFEVIDRKQHESERDQIIRASLLSPEAAAEVDALEIQFAQPAYDPALDAGCERLWDAIRDTNTTEGDQK